MVRRFEKFLFYAFEGLCGSFKARQAIDLAFLLFTMKVIIAVASIVSLVFGQHLPIREHPVPWMSGTECLQKLLPLNRSEREDLIYAMIENGNFPVFLRTLVPIKTSASINGKDYTLEYFVTADYLSIGNDSDYVRIPMTPLLAQRIANSLSYLLPTKKMVDQIYAAAAVKLPPQPIPPDSLMTTLPRFIQHNDSIQKIRKPLLDQFPLGSLVAGIKKDIIIHQKIYSDRKPNKPKPVVIYGWHMLNGDAIQPPNNWHQETYVDYSHGVRLVQEMATINGADISLTDIVCDELFHVLISDTLLDKPYYEISNP